MDIIIIYYIIIGKSRLYPITNTYREDVKYTYVIYYTIIVEYVIVHLLIHCEYHPLYLYGG
jgi:hypothetical protein